MRLSHRTCTECMHSHSSSNREWVCRDVHQQHQQADQIDGVLTTSLQLKLAVQVHMLRAGWVAKACGQSN